MNNYVTLLNHVFLPQCLSLHSSLLRHVEGFKLWILCVDDLAYKILSDINLTNVVLMKLSEYETQDLIDLKKTRSIGEYCWTLTPFAPKFVFSVDPTVMTVTYIDADICFYNNPASIFEEFDNTNKSVLITDHAFSPDCDQSSLYGKYCVQFIIFRRNDSEIVRKWWEDKCVDWCFSYSDNGRFGDQKYLDRWPRQFKEYVHVLNQKELCLGPWNSSRFPYSDCVFYHFHNVRIINNKPIVLGNYKIPKPTFKNIYVPYFNDLEKSVGILKEVGFSSINQTRRPFLISKLLIRIRFLLSGK